MRHTLAGVIVIVISSVGALTAIAWGQWYASTSVTRSSERAARDRIDESLIAESEKKECARLKALNEANQRKAQR